MRLVLVTHIKVKENEWAGRDEHQITVITGIEAIGFDDDVVSRCDQSQRLDLLDQWIDHVFVK